MARNKKKIIRVTTVPMSLKAFCDGMLKELSEKYEVVAVSSPGEDLDLVAEREGVRTIAVPMERHISLWKDVKSLWLMTKVFRKEKPDIVHSMTPKAGLVTMVAGWLTGVPVRVHTFTGLVWPTSTGLKRRILMLTDKILCTCATHVIPEGQGVMDDLRSGGITNKPMKVLGYGNVKGVDMEYFDPVRIVSELNTNDRKLTTNLSVNSSELGTNTNFTNDTNCSINAPSSVELNTNDTNLTNKENKINGKFVAIHGNLCSKEKKDSVDSCDSCSKDRPFTFIFVGRIVGDKGVNELVEAFTQLHEKYENTKLVLVGPYEEHLDPVSELTQNRIKTNPAIDAVGKKFGDDLLFEYLKADCHVLPSYREGFPNTPMEAGALGLPNIVTDINGAREIVVNEENGLVVPSKDAKALHNAMERMLTDSAMREKMKQNARPMIESRFEKSFVRKCLYDFYDEILK